MMIVKSFFMPAKLRIFFQSAYSVAQNPVLIPINKGVAFTFCYFV